MRQTHTYVELELPPEMFLFIRTRMLEAGYNHAVDGNTVDMHGIAVTTTATEEYLASINKG